MEFNDTVLPIIRGVCAKTVSYDIIPVQPISKPAGKLYYMDYDDTEWIELEPGVRVQVSISDMLTF